MNGADARAARAQLSVVLQQMPEARKGRVVLIQKIRADSSYMLPDDITAHCLCLERIPQYEQL